MKWIKKFFSWFFGGGTEEEVKDDDMTYKGELVPKKTDKGKLVKNPDGTTNVRYYRKRKDKL